jgi:hypothetical protein
MSNNNKNTNCWKRRARGMSAVEKQKNNKSFPLSTSFFASLYHFRLLSVWKIFFFFFFLFFVPLTQKWDTERVPFFASELLAGPITFLTIRLSLSKVYCRLCEDMGLKKDFCSNATGSIGERLMVKENFESLFKWSMKISTLFKLIKIKLIIFHTLSSLTPHSELSLSWKKNKSTVCRKRKTSSNYD